MNSPPPTNKRVRRRERKMQWSADHGHPTWNTTTTSNPTNNNDNNTTTAGPVHLRPVSTFDHLLSVLIAPTHHLYRSARNTLRNVPWFLLSLYLVNAVGKLWCWSVFSAVYFQETITWSSVVPYGGRIHPVRDLFVFLVSLAVHIIWFIVVFKKLVLDNNNTNFNYNYLNFKNNNDSSVTQDSNNNNTHNNNNNNDKNQIKVPPFILWGCVASTPLAGLFAAIFGLFNPFLGFVNMAALIAFLAYWPLATITLSMVIDNNIVNNTRV